MNFKDEKPLTFLLIAIYHIFILISVVVMALGIWRDVLSIQITGGMGLVVSIRLNLERWHFYTCHRTETTPARKGKV